MYLLCRQKGDDGFKTQFDVVFTFGQVFCEILRYCGVTMLPLNRLISNCLIIYFWSGPKWISENIFQNCKMKNGFALVNDISTHWFPNLFGLIDRKISELTCNFWELCKYLGQTALPFGKICLGKPHLIASSLQDKIAIGNVRGSSNLLDWHLTLSSNGDPKIIQNLNLLSFNEKNKRLGTHESRKKMIEAVTMPKKHDYCRGTVLLQLCSRPLRKGGWTPTYKHTLVSFQIFLWFGSWFLFCRSAVWGSEQHILFWPWTCFCWNFQHVWFVHPAPIHWRHVSVFFVLHSTCQSLQN